MKLGIGKKSARYASPMSTCELRHFGCSTNCFSFLGLSRLIPALLRDRTVYRNLFALSPFLMCEYSTRLFLPDLTSTVDYVIKERTKR